MKFKTLYGNDVNAEKKFNCEYLSEDFEKKTVKVIRGRGCNKL